MTDSAELTSDRPPQVTIGIRGVGAAVGLLTVAYGMSLFWDGDATNGSGLARALRTVLGLGMLMAGPGAVAALCLARRRRLGGVAFMSRAWLLNQALFVVGSAAIKAGDVSMSPWICFVLMMGLTALSLAWAYLSRSETRVVLPVEGRWVVGAMMLCPALLLLIAEPTVVSRHSYWPLETEAELFELGRVTHDSSQFRVSYSPECKRIAERRYGVQTWPAAILVENRAATTRRYALKLLVESHVEGTLRIRCNGRTVAEQYLHPRMRHSRFPRNYPPPNCMLSSEADLPPGPSTFELGLSVEEPDRLPRVVVTDVSGLDYRAIRRVFGRHYVVAALGDVQGNLNQSANLSDHLWFYTASYDGERADGGGYSISNLPFPYYVDNFALLLMGDSPMSLNTLQLGLVALTIPLLLALADARGCRSVALACAAMLCYGVLMRLHVEALYMQALLTFAFMLCTYHYLRGERGWFCLAAFFVAMSKGGVALLGLLFVLGVLLMKGRRKRMLVDGAVVTGACALGVLAFQVAKDVWPVLRVFANEMASDEYAGRFHLIRHLWDAPLRKARPLLLAGGKLTLWVLLASCLMPFELLRGRDRWAWVLAGTGLAFHVIICLSDPGITSFAVIQHPLNYFVPAGPLLFAAGLRAMRAAGKQPSWVHALVCAACFAGCLRVAGSQSKPIRVPRHEVMHATAVADLLVRRAIGRIGSGEHELASRDATRAAERGETFADDRICRPVFGHALLVQAHAAIKLGKLDEAQPLLRRVIGMGEDFADAVRCLHDGLERDGHIDQAGAVKSVLDVHTSDSR